MSTDYRTWANVRLDLDERSTLTPDLARADYLAWVSDAGGRPEPRTRQRTAVRAHGGRCRGVGRELRYLGVKLKPDRDDYGYRVGGYLERSPAQILDALRALQRGGLVSDPRELNRAFEELTT